MSIIAHTEGKHRNGEVKLTALDIGICEQFEKDVPDLTLIIGKDIPQKWLYGIIYWFFPYG